MKKKEVNPKKTALIQLSKTIKVMIELGSINASSVNEGIIELYENENGETEFKTFGGWKKEGYKVKKGSTALTIWGKPRKGTKKVEDAKTEEEKYKFFPMAYLFSSDQVEKIV